LKLEQADADRICKRVVDYSVDTKIVAEQFGISRRRVQAILQEQDHVTENPNKQGRKRPWVRFERDYSLVTAHLDWFYNSREQWVLAVEEDASRFVYALIETDARSAERTVELLD
jgi:hypothetical protein